MEEQNRQNYNKNKKKKILLITIPIALLLIALAITLPLLLIKHDKKIVDIVFEQSSIFNVGQDMSNQTMIVTYNDDSIEQITFGELTISDEDKASLDTVGEKNITITYKDFSKVLNFLIVWNEFTDQEKQAMQINDVFFEYDGEAQSVYLSSLPEGASAVYSINNQNNFQTSYSVSEVGEYTIYVKVSKQDYLDYTLSFKISIVDTSVNLEGFSKEDENLFTYQADSALKTFDISAMIALADENAKYKVFSDEGLLNEVSANALPLNSGGGESVFYLQVYFDSNSLSRIYKIKISQSHAYQVNFYFKDEVIKNEKVEGNMLVQAPDFSKEGYVINGWKVSDEIVSFPLTINEDTNIYADYSLVNYDISFVLDGGQITTSKTTYTIEDEAFTLPTPTKEGYEFLGWSGTDLEEVTKTVTIEKGSLGNREYTANWKILTFDVSIPENQDAYTITYGNLSVEYGKDFSFKVDLTDAYNQSAIIVKANGEELQKQGDYYIISNITQNVEVTIEGYKLNEYMVTFTENENAYQIIKTGDTVSHGGDFKFKIELEPAYSESAIVVKAGQELLTAGEDGYYTIENITENVSVLVEGATINTYTIRWLNYDGSVLETDENVTYGTMPTFDGENPTKAESVSHTYTFSGWDSEIVIATADKDYTAKFSETIKTFAVNFGENITVLAGEDQVTSGQSLEYGTTITISYTETAGYEKTSFKVNENEQENNYSIEVTEQIDVEYSERAINYTLKYNLDGGSLSGQKESYTVEDEAFTLPTPTKEGYEFLGWSGTDLEEVTKTVTIKKGSLGNREYTATWKILQFTYSFYNGDELLKTATIDFGSAIIQPNEIPTRDSIDGINYVFSGWDKEVPEYISDEDLVFYAQFKEETFTSGLNFTYSAFDEGYIVDIGSAQETTIIVPAIYNNKKVVAVKNEGFANNNQITSITFEGNILSIGANSFANSSNLNTIKGLENITSIPNNAFEGLINLTSFTIGDNVLAIGERAFANSGLTAVNIPASVISIENGAFDGCQIIAYTVDEGNSNYASNGDGNLYNKNFTEIILYAQGQSQTTFVVPNSVMTIKSGAFTSLESQNLSKKKSLSDTTLLTESKLKNIVIGKNVNKIEENALPSNVIVFSYSASSLDGWDENLLKQNEIYYQGAWEMQDEEPVVTLSASAFKTGIYTNWQSYINDDVKFLEVVMPGSHDSGTNGLGDLYRTQNSGYYDQLSAGVRYFDVRVAEYNGTVRSVHADSGELLIPSSANGVPFQDILNDINRFIKENPSEVIILDFQHIWNDFSSKVLPMIVSNLPSQAILNKSLSQDLSTLTMGQLRKWQINLILVVNDSQSYSPDFSANNFLYQRTQYLLSPYDSGNHGSTSSLINAFAGYISQRDNSKIFILQSQRTGTLSNLTIYELEADLRASANDYARSLSLEKNQSLLSSINIIMRDFVADDGFGASESAQVTMQSILFLNVYKGNISADKLNYYKILLDFESVDNLSKSY